MIGDNNNAWEPLWWGLIKFAFFLALATGFGRLLYRPFFVSGPERHPWLWAIASAMLFGVMQHVRGGSLVACVAQATVSVLTVLGALALERRVFPGHVPHEELHPAPPHPAESPPDPNP